MGNYPDGTWGGDPAAPWNEGEKPECPNRDCMAQLEPDWSFCPSCGWRIDWDELLGNKWFVKVGDAR